MVTLSAKGIVLDADGEMELADDRESVLKFIAAVLAEVQEDGGTALRFDCTSSDGCLLVSDEKGWHEMYPLSDAVLATFHRLLGDRLFGLRRRLAVRLLGSMLRYEPTTLCRVEGEHSTQEWEARLKPTAIWFKSRRVLMERSGIAPERSG